MGLWEKQLGHKCYLQAGISVSSKLRKGKERTWSSSLWPLKAADTIKLDSVPRPLMRKIDVCKHTD